MNEPVTILAPSASPQASSALPADLYEQVRSRVRLQAVLVALGFAVGPLVFFGILALAVLLGDELPAEYWDGSEFLWWHAVVILISLLLWRRARSEQVSASALLRLGLTYESVVCFVIGIMTYWSEYDAYGHIPRLTWIPAVVILFPLIMPGPPRQLFWGAIAAASMAPVSLMCLHVAGQVPVTADLYLSAILNSGIAVLFAYVGARTVYGLGRQVAEARELGSYRLERRLGSGGMGEVWRARHRMLARPAAVKLIRTDVLNAEANRPLAIERFEQEAQATAGLRSPHTVELYDYGVTTDGTFYYVMELLEGLDLATLVDRFGPLSADRAVFLLRQACLSLSEAHAKGLVHRDVKPANVFVCRYGEEVDFVKVLDFGLVKGTVQRRDDSTSSAEVIGGTPAFIAPEQATGEGEVDARADVYALGCVAYWLLTGAYVFTADTTGELVMKHVREAPVPPSERTELAVPPELERIVMACLEKEPMRRPATAREVERQLADVADGRSWTGDRARAWWDRHVPVASA